MTAATENEQNFVFLISFLSELPRFDLSLEFPDSQMCEALLLTSDESTTKPKPGVFSEICCDNGVFFCLAFFGVFKLLKMTSDGVRVLLKVEALHPLLETLEPLAGYELASVPHTELALMHYYSVSAL